MYVALLVLKNALRHKLRTTLTIVGIVVAITAFGLLRTIVDAWYAGANASSSGRLVGGACQLVRRRVHLRAQLLSAVRDQCAVVPRDVSRVSFVAGGKEGVSHRSCRRDRGSQARRTVRVENRRSSSTARHDLSRHMDVYAARHLRRRRQGDRSVDVLLPLGLPERNDEEAVPASRGSDRRVRRATQGSAAGVRGILGDRRDLQEFARRDADGNGEGVPI